MGMYDSLVLCFRTFPPARAMIPFCAATAAAPPAAARLASAMYVYRVPAGAGCPMATWRVRGMREHNTHEGTLRAFCVRAVSV